MKWQIVLFSVAVTGACVLIGWVFWEQELKYALPTPIPKNYRDVKIGDKVDLSNYVMSNKPIMLHFFNPDCSCSRFNIMEFERIARKYGDKINVYVILQTEDESAVQKFKNKYDLDLPVLLDRSGAISDATGIYSTPQCVLLDSSSTIYFKGNYNLTRYCTRKETSFADLAAQNLLNGKSLPPWIVTELSVPYGCQLPSDLPDLVYQTNK